MVVDSAERRSCVIEFYMFYIVEMQILDGLREAWKTCRRRRLGLV